MRYIRSALAVLADVSFVAVAVEHFFEKFTDR